MILKIFIISQRYLIAKMCLIYLLALMGRTEKAITICSRTRSMGKEFSLWAKSIGVLQRFIRINLSYSMAWLCNVQKEELGLIQTPFEMFHGCNDLLKSKTEIINIYK